MYEKNMKFLADESCDFTVVRALRDSEENIVAPHSQINIDKSSEDLTIHIINTQKSGDRIQDPE